MPLAEALVRAMTVQSTMIDLLDTVPLFEYVFGEEENNTDPFKLLIHHLKQLVFPEGEEREQEEKGRRNTRLELVQSLRLNKRKEKREKESLEA